MAQPTSGYLYDRNVILADARRTVNGSATTTALDVSQFKSNGVTFLFYTDTVTSSGNVTATVQHSDTTTSGDFSSVSGATKTITATGLVTLFVPNVAKRYVRLSWALNSGTSTATSTFVYGQPDDATVFQGYTNSPAA